MGRSLEPGQGSALSCSPCSCAKAKQYLKHCSTGGWRRRVSSSQPFSPQNEIPLVRNATQSYAGSTRCGGHGAGSVPAPRRSPGSLLIPGDEGVEAGTPCPGAAWCCSPPSCSRTASTAVSGEMLGQEELHKARRYPPPVLDTKPRRLALSPQDKLQSSPGGSCKPIPPWHRSPSRQSCGHPHPSSFARHRRGSAAN